MDNNRLAELTEVFRSRFNTSPEMVARAPGRVDLMGSHTDYNEGYVLTMPLDLDTWILFSRREDGESEVMSLDLGEKGTFPVDSPWNSNQPVWLQYVSGVAQVLKDDGFDVPGVNCLIHTTLPIGGGLSSSASLECAAAVMFQHARGFRLERKDMALVCQRAENGFVGMPCGILDQYTSVFGKEGGAILLDCRELSHVQVSLPAEVQPVICDTRAPHLLVDSEYEKRRNQCFKGADVIRRSYPVVKTLRDVTPEFVESAKQDLSDESYKRCSFIVRENIRVLEAASELHA